MEDEFEFVLRKGRDEFFVSEGSVVGWICIEFGGIVDEVGVVIFGDLRRREDGGFERGERMEGREEGLEKDENTGGFFAGLEDYDRKTGPTGFWEVVCVVFFLGGELMEAFGEVEV